LQDGTRAGTAALQNPALLSACSPTCRVCYKRAENRPRAAVGGVSARGSDGVCTMGLRVKFNLVILAAFAVGFAIAAVLLNRVFVDSAREQVLQHARLMITAANAIRTYTVQEIAPQMSMERDGKFVPQTVPAYAAQKNLKAVQEAFHGYSYREAALNPTNLSDRAQDWEADIINLFRNDPDKTELTVERDTSVGPTLNMARPIVVRSETCLRCHSTPAAAPPVLVSSYGAVNGFGWKLNETIGAQILTVPMAIPLKLARDAYVTFLIVLVATFAIIFIILNLMLHYLVIAPVKRLSATADKVSLGEEGVESYVKPGKDEISSLSVSFNRMRESLKHAMAMLK
jgi:protein-histidine pros-kinase